MEPKKKGGRPPTGSAVWHDGRWHARITMPDGTRPLVPILPANIPQDDKPRASQLAAVMSRRVRELGAVPVASGETVNEWTERWLEVRKAKGLRSTEKDRSRLRTHILPKLGVVAMVGVTRKHIEELVQLWDARVALGKLSWKTASNSWGLLTKMFSDARKSKRLDLRMREDNPCDDVEGPDGGVTKAKAYLYPSEFERLMACQEVPVRWRRLVAAAVYLYVRRGELAALRCSDVDLEHGSVLVHRSEGDDEEGDGDGRETKTGISRPVPIEPELLPLLRSLCEGLAPADLLFEMPHESTLSSELRRFLKLAGVERAALFAPTKDRTRKNLTWHDLRATGITWMAVRGDDPLRVMRRAGHADFATTQKYIREAENARAGFGAAFPPLPAQLGFGGGLGFRLQNTQETSRNMRPQRESNPVDKTDENLPNKANRSEHDGGLGATRMDRIPPNPELPSHAGDPVEAAIAAALEGASRAGEWSTVARLAGELEARRLARAGAGVVDLAAERRKRGAT